MGVTPYARCVAVRSTRFVEDNPHWDPEEAPEPPERGVEIVPITGWR